MKTLKNPLNSNRETERDKVNCKIETTAVASTAQLILTHTADSTIKRIV